MRRYIELAIGLLAVASVSAGSSAAAQSLPVLPYEGQLDQNGTPITGTRTFEFMLTESPLGPTDVGCWEGSEPTFAGGCYASGPVDLELVGGAFAVDLGVGATAAFSTEQEAWVFGNRVIYLSIAVGDSAATLTPLAGTQQLVNRQRVGYAVSNPSADGFIVEGGLVVDGAVAVGATSDALPPASLRLGQRQVGDSLTYSGRLEFSTLSSGFDALLTVHRANASGNITLYLSEADDYVFQDGDVRIDDGGNLVVEGDLRVNGTIRADEGIASTIVRPEATFNTVSGTGCDTVPWTAPNGSDRSFCALAQFGTQDSPENDRCNINGPSGGVWQLESCGGADCEMRCMYW